MKYYQYLDAFDQTASLINNEKSVFNVTEVSQLINKSTQFVRDAIYNKELLAYGIHGRVLNKSTRRKTYCIPKSNIIFYLLKNSMYSMKDYIVVKNSTTSICGIKKENFNQIYEKTLNT